MISSLLLFFLVFLLLGSWFLLFFGCNTPCFSFLVLVLCFHFSLFCFSICSCYFSANVVLRDFMILYRAPLREATEMRIRGPIYLTKRLYILYTYDTSTLCLTSRGDALFSVLFACKPGETAKGAYNDNLMQQSCETYFPLFQHTTTLIVILLHLLTTLLHLTFSLHLRRFLVSTSPSFIF